MNEPLIKFKNKNQEEHAILAIINFVLGCLGIWILAYQKEYIPGHLYVIFFFSCICIWVYFVLHIKKFKKYSQASEVILDGNSNDGNPNQ